MADWDFVLAPATVSVEFDVNQTEIMFNSLRLLDIADEHSGLSDWVMHTAHAMTDEQLQTNRLVTAVLKSRTVMSEYRKRSFPAFVAYFAQNPPDDYKALAFDWVHERDDYPGDDAFFSDEETFISYLESVMQAKHGEDYTPQTAHWQRLFAALQDPQALTETIVSYLRFMWEEYLEEEWAHIKPTVDDARAVFSQMDYDGMTGYEVIEAVTGRDMRGSGKLNETLKSAKTLVFVPSPHLGPYVGWRPFEDRENALMMYFGARPPRNAPTVTTPALSRNELLVRLNALSDETRLKILELLTRHDELCAQDFITSLDLSQSSASRHLRQLTASGYVSERRRDVAKCYTLNPERIDDTINALRDFLQKSD